MRRSLIPFLLLLAAAGPSPSFTNGTFSGTLGVTGAATLSGGGALTGSFAGGTFTGTTLTTPTVNGGALSGTFTGTHTYSGAVTLSAASTALTVTNNVSVGGSVTLGANATQALQAVPLQQIPPGVVVPAGGSIQAAHDALPATGGSILLVPNTTYVLNARLTITKPNVTIVAPSWSTIIQRGPSLTSGATVFATSGATKFIFRGATVDGNAPTVSGGSTEVECDGAGCLIQHVQIINPNNIALTLAGVGSRADNNTIIGLNSATIGSYGIWAINHQQVFITDNTISNTRIDGIGFDGEGSVVSGNHLFGNQVKASASTIGGGQIVQYPGFSGTLIEGNTISKGGGDWSYGIELNGPNTSVIGNTVVNQNNIGIAINANSSNGLLIAGNTVINSGQVTSIIAGRGAGITVSGPLTNVTITGNRFADTQGSPTQSWGVFFYVGSYSNIVVTNNDLTNNVFGALSASGATHQIAFNNLGVDDVSGSTISAALAVTGGITTPTIGNGASALKFDGSGQWSANGVVATTMTGVGPVGSHTTIQEWFTVTDSAGTVRYIPAY